jgi:hypothetical protein
MKHTRESCCKLTMTIHWACIKHIPCVDVDRGLLIGLNSLFVVEKEQSKLENVLDGWCLGRIHQKSASFMSCCV